MTALTRITLYVDPKLPMRDALEVAVEMARRSGASLEVVAAVGREDDRWFRTSLGQELRRALREDGEARLRGVARAAGEALDPGRVSAALLDGEAPWHALVLHASAQAPDLLVVPAPDARIDSAIQHLFRKCPAPVWAVHPGRGAFPRRVLAAVDPGAAGTPKRRLARRVLELVRRVAATGPMELHVVHVWGLPGEALLLARFGPAAAKEHLEAEEAVARREVDELLAEAGVKGSAAVHLGRGDAAEAIAELAQRLDAELVAIGSTGRTGVAGFLIGNTAEEVTARLARSVVVVKPEGFVSPAGPAAGGWGAAA